MVEEARVGVFICHCGKNIAGVADIKRLLAFSSRLRGVVASVDNVFLCSEEGQGVVRRRIREDKLNRVVIAACSPELHLSTFQRVVEGEGLDPAFCELADIRQYTMGTGALPPEEANLKAEELTDRTVRRIRLKKAPQKVRVELEQSALVIGGGVAGCEAALELADRGYQVYLVEREPTIGGKMALLFKVFPTDDCAPCILAPKTAYVNMHKNIKLLTMAEVKGVEGFIGNFMVTIVKRPRYVDEAKCTGCGLCVEKCPVRAPNEYSLGLGFRKAIYIPYPQAIPRKATISRGHCLYLQKGVCRLCEKVCPAGAIEFGQGDEEIRVKVGAIIVATGFDEHDPSLKREYGYGRFKNVITQLQLARLLDTDGPTGGLLKRPSDGEAPKVVVMVQCVGSRDEKANPYCSNGVCCMASLKHAKMIKEKYVKDAEIYICYIDIRSSGRGYEEYYKACREDGVNFIRGVPGELIEDLRTGDILVSVEDTTLRQPLEIRANLVVLSCAMVPPKGARELAEALGISLGPDGFFQEVHPKLRPVETNVRGIYICGAAQGPKDIQGCIAQARAAALCAEGELRRGWTYLPAEVVRKLN